MLARHKPDVAPGHFTETRQYDARNRLVAVRQCLTLVASCEGAGSAAITQYGFDSLRTHIDYADAATPDVTFGYDLNGNVTSIASAGLGAIEAVYDGLNRLTHVRDALGRWMTSTWDAVGNVTGLVYPDGAQVTYVYDEDNRLAGLIDADGRGTTFGYDDANNLVETVTPALTTTRRYDGASRLTGVWHTTASDVVMSHTLGLDGVGNRVTVTEQYSAVTNVKVYGYDALSRLVTASERYAGNAITSTWAYTLNGNRTEQVTNRGGVWVTTTWAYNAANQVVSETDGTRNTAYEYDAGGNRIGEWLNGSRVVTHTYDAENRLVGFVSLSVTQAMVYDGLGRRVVLSEGTRNTQYLYRDLSWQIVGVNEDQYIRAGRQLAQAEVGGAVYWFASDALGSVVGLVDAGGGVAQRSFYAPFGEMVDAT